MNKYQTPLLALLFAFGSASAQRANQDTTIAEVDVEAAGLLIIRNLVEGAIVVTDEGAVYADADTNCRGFYVNQGSDYLTLAFPCFPYPSEFEYRYSTWDKNHDKFDVYRCIGMPKVKLYMVDTAKLSR